MNYQRRRRIPGGGGIEPLPHIQSGRAGAFRLRSASYGGHAGPAATETRQARRGEDAVALPGIGVLAAVVTVLFLTGAVLSGTAYATSTNAAPYAESFEAAVYTNGFPIAGTNGWNAIQTTAGVISTDTTVTAAELAYGGAFPIPGPHTNVLQVTDEITDAIGSATGGVVVVDFMALPDCPQNDPSGDTNWQYAFYLNANSNLVVWHQNRVGAPQNEWRALTNGPTLTPGTWARFTVVQDYARGRFQVRVNGGAWIPDSAGWTDDGTANPGSWLYMVQSNRVMSALGIGETQTNYVDDIVVTNRGVTWSTNGFVEGVTNNGAIDNANPLTIGLVYDTFAGADQEVFGTNKVQVSGVPSNLTVVVTRSSATQLTVAVTGTAVNHESANSVTNATMTLLGAAFTLTNAADVAGASRSDLRFTFRNTPRLSYSRGVFDEATASNDGSIDNSTPLLITLTNAVFAGTVGDNFGADTNKVQVVNLPAALQAVMTLTNFTQLSVTLTGQAVANAAGDSLSNLTFAFQSGAFSNTPAFSVVGAATTNLAIHFLDPTAAPELQYGATTFPETAYNDGTVTGTVLTLVAKDFAGTNNEDFVASSKATATHVPNGLSLHLVRTGTHGLTLSFSGAATAHAAVNNVTNLTVQFADSAFVGGNAAAVSNEVRTDLAIVFHDQPALGCPLTHFGEALANNGAISNSLAVTLAGELFAAGPFAANTHYMVSGVPAGLTFVLTRDSASQVTVSLSGNAASHTAADSVTNLRLTFLNPAFAIVPAANVNGHPIDFAVDFRDPPLLSCANTHFGEDAANDGAISNTLAITLAGESFGVGPFAENTQYTISGVPAGLTFVLTRNGAAQVTASLTGNATAHTAADSIANLHLTFLNAAFTVVPAANVGGHPIDFAVDFRDLPSLNCANTHFTEAAANDGTVTNMLAVTLGGETFAAGPFAENTQYTISGVPAGLAFVLTRDSASQVTASLIGSATSHTAADSIANLHLTFLNPAFTAVAATSVLGHPIDFAVDFRDPPALTYSGDTFNELSLGTINNNSPIAISLAGDAFTGSVGSDFVLANKVTVLNLPNGLTATVTKDNDSQVSVRLIGTAPYNDAADSVTNLTFQFQSTAFAVVAANRVTGAVKSDLKVTFRDDTPFAYHVPYEEPFEVYTNGFWMTLAPGWSGEHADAAVVTADTSITTPPSTYPGSLPIATNHAQSLCVQSDLQGAIQSAPGQKVYLDFMSWPTPMVDTPQIDTNMQLAFYVSTNAQLVIWHQNRLAAPSNELRVLSGGPIIETNRWNRFTVCQDYSNAMFQVQINCGAPIADAAGWTGPGGAPGGSWFYMVRTNDHMSSFGVAGVGGGLIEDLTVRTSVLHWGPTGTMFLFR